MPDTRDRSSDTMGASGSNRVVDSPSNRPGEVAVHHPAQGVPDVPAVGGQQGGLGAGPPRRSEQLLDDGREGRDEVQVGGRAQGGVQGGVLHGQQRAAEHRLGENAEQVPAPGPDQRLPVLVGQAGGSLTFVERVQARGQALPEGDRGPADEPGDGGPFALGVAGHVDADPERQRAGGQALGQRGLAGADDPGEQHVGVGEHAVLVEHPRVVDERPTGEHVGADEQPVAAEPGFGQERVRPGEGGRGGRVRRHAERQPGP